MSRRAAHTPFAIPVRYDLDFSFDETPALHFAGNPYTSHFWNALSILAPRTEGFLIRAMKQARPEVTNPELREQVDSFLRQEGLHSRHHNRLNARLASLGYDVERAGAIAEKNLRAVTNANEIRGALTFVIVGEYAIYAIAKAVLECPAILAATVPEVRRLIEWHSLEEMEHQSIAHEVYEHLYGIGVRDRLAHARALVTACRVLAGTISRMEAVLLERERSIASGARVEHWRYLYVSPGLLRRVGAKLPRFFGPAFRYWSDPADVRLIEWGLGRIRAPMSS
jgi:predicted metal-dependent hydrolase